jgi:hypothetical protein
MAPTWKQTFFIPPISNFQHFDLVPLPRSSRASIVEGAPQPEIPAAVAWTRFFERMLESILFKLRVWRSESQGHHL